MQTKIEDVIRVLSSHAPLSWQEEYDNCGLLVGNRQTVITGIMTCLDVTLEVIHETIQKGANLIVSHHPIIFRPLKKLTPGGFVENIILKAIKNDIAIYVIHTNLDNAYHRGINETLAKIIGLNNRSILQEKQGLLSQLQCVLSENEAKMMLPQLNLLKPHSLSYQAGTANISEGKLSMVLLNHQLSEAFQIIDSSTDKTLFKEVTDVKNTSHLVGAGMVGYLDQPMTPIDFLDLLKNALSLKVIKHTFLCKEKIHKVALCGGSGSFLLTDALRAQADIFVTSDYKYHQFQEANNKIIIADIGHYESEVCAANLIKQIISEKFTNFDVWLTTVVTNPVYYHQ